MQSMCMHAIDSVTHSHDPHVAPHSASQPVSQSVGQSVTQLSASVSHSPILIRNIWERELRRSNPQQPLHPNSTHTSQAGTHAYSTPQDVSAPRHLTPCRTQGEHRHVRWCICHMRWADRCTLVAPGQPRKIVVAERPLSPLRFAITAHLAWSIASVLGSPGPSDCGNCGSRRSPRPTPPTPGGLVSSRMPGMKW